MAIYKRHKLDFICHIEIHKHTLPCTFYNMWFGLCMQLTHKWHTYAMCLCVNVAHVKLLCLLARLAVQLACSLIRLFDQFLNSQPNCFLHQFANMEITLEIVHRFKTNATVHCEHETFISESFVLSFMGFWVLEGFSKSLNPVFNTDAIFRLTLKALNLLHVRYQQWLAICNVRKPHNNGFVSGFFLAFISIVVADIIIVHQAHYFIKASSMTT